MLNLTPIELFYVYETLMKSTSTGLDNLDNKKFILFKIRQTLLDKLDFIKDESDKQLYKVWINQEEHRVKDLSTRNINLNLPVPARPSLKKKEVNFNKTSKKVVNKRKKV